MPHPGPPRFLAVGEATQLAPRDPDPDATYRWRIAEQPAASAVTLDDAPVVRFEPDAPGVYTVALDAPEESYELTVRVFPGDLSVPGHFLDEFAGRSGGAGDGTNTGVPMSASGSGSGVAAHAGRRGGAGRPRVDLSVDVDDGVVTVRADATAGVGGTDDGTLGVDFRVDDRDSTPRSFRVSTRKAVFGLDDVDGSVRVHAVALGKQYGVPTVVTVHGDGTVEFPNEPPTWSTEMSVYEVYVRGFKDPDPDQSVFEVIAENLDYVQSLSVDTLWLTPVLQHDGFDHGYNITDFHSVADDLGTEAEFERLVEAAHERDMHVLFDLVLNHSARDHEFFQRAESGDPEYRDWYEWEDDGSPATYFEWPYIANLNFRNLKVRRHLLDAVEKWAGYVDGFRCDMAWAVPISFWREIRDRVRAQDETFLLLDETIPYVADYHHLAFQTHFDTELYSAFRSVGAGDADAEAITDAIDERTLTGFPDGAGFLCYVENHDEERYVDACGRAATEAAAGAQFTLPGVPMLYAGQEIGERTRRGEIHWDHADEDLREHYRRLAETRETTPALGPAGDYEPVPYESDSDAVVAFAREADERYVVALHFGEGTASVSVPGERVATRDVVTGTDVAGDGDTVTVESVAVLPTENQRTDTGDI
ncbi:alpha-amylase [Halomicroarcula sp. F13]|uniref:Alpha-amylase n=1 Tax=Haloarcula rubra TaxID=2487747 RepID=A0AAW4PP05_9EURY|nr:alpha-amylase family glycosyl hydrolase [Halomicroarcula rubra]MBX0322866.1 alpha-amylase [Halomicroarcula rubra]